MSLNSGERQVTPNIEEVRADHVNRYKWAASIIPEHSRVVDFAAGVGYGSRILADAGHAVNGYDIDLETVSYAFKHYSHTDTPLHMVPEFHIANGNIANDLPEADVAISFETIEHIQDPRPLLKSLRSAPMLIASVPNEDVMPWQRPDGSTTMFHFRHYTGFEFASLLMECGWKVRNWYGQVDTESEVGLGVHGRTLIAVCDRVDIPEVQKPPQKHIAILGLGPSLDQYTDQVKRAGGRSNFCDETWAINALGDLFACDLVFHMDDIRVQMIRAEAKPASNIAAMVRWIKDSKVPVVTSRAHPDYPALVEFPLEDVLNHLGHDYFNNTAAYAVAFAIHIGATKISCWGMDFTYPNVNHAEKGKACVEFWLGQAHARGIEIGLPKTSTLMDSCYPQDARLYGYDCVDVGFNVGEDGHLALTFKERDTLPTAEAIEANYNHERPISEQHQSLKENSNEM